MIFILVLSMISTSGLMKVQWFLMFLDVFKMPRFSHGGDCGQLLQHFQVMLVTALNADPRVGSSMLLEVPS